ncbi:hypothetical protein TNCV_1416431 [Trichonephila clavipes]|nr:hypothetical protein TNCV_1416431 [Trichonephila clavipes]
MQKTAASSLPLSINQRVVPSQSFSNSLPDVFNGLAMTRTRDDHIKYPMVAHTITPNTNARMTMSNASRPSAFSLVPPGTD